MDFTTSTAPWWFVAALAGGFTVIGGLISIGGAAINDWFKSRRELKLSRQAETLEYGANLLAIAEKFRDLGLIRKTLTAEEWVALVEEKGHGLLDVWGVAFSRFELIVPNELWDETQSLATSTIVLLSPNTKPVEYQITLNLQDNAIRAFRDGVRKHRGAAKLSSDRIRLDRTIDKKTSTQ